VFCSAINFIFLQADSNVAPAAAETVQGGAAIRHASEGQGTEQEQVQPQYGMGGGGKEDDNGEVMLVEDDQQHCQLLEEEHRGQLGEAMDSHEDWFS
jgi:hypothetical protein